MQDKGNRSWWQSPAPVHPALRLEAVKTGLVLGGGGLVGMGYHAGVLKALDEAGLDPCSSDVVVGTSAGAIMAAYLTTGWTPERLYDLAHGRHADSPSGPEAYQAEVRAIFDPLAHHRGERLRRLLGGAFAAAAARGVWRRVAGDRMPPQTLRRAFPSGMYSTSATRARLWRELPAGWPDAELYIPAVDLFTGARTVFGMPDAYDAPLPEAVLASTSIPGVFPPVRIGGRWYVDGGVASATSLDLATAAGCERIVCVAPLSYQKENERLSLADRSALKAVLVRSQFARSLKKEVAEARTRGIDVLVVSPLLAELAVHGANSMRPYDRAVVIESARRNTLRMLEAF